LQEDACASDKRDEERREENRTSPRKEQVFCSSENKKRVRVIAMQLKTRLLLRRVSRSRSIQEYIFFDRLLQKETFLSLSFSLSISSAKSSQSKSSQSKSSQGKSSQGKTGRVNERGHDNQEETLKRMNFHGMTLTDTDGEADIEVV
jgi:hypothetical protein